MTVPAVLGHLDTSPGRGALLVAEAERLAAEQAPAVSA
jgi:hypothetical protein